MWGGFPKVVREVFPNAKLVVDRFHVMQALIKELNTIRKQTRVTEKGARFLILKNKVDLKESEKEKLERILKCSSRLRQAYKLKEDFREIYESQLTIEEGAERFKRWLRKARKIYGDVIGTIRNHLPEICNYFESRTTNGAMEGINNRIKQVSLEMGPTHLPLFQLNPAVGTITVRGDDTAVSVTNQGFGRLLRPAQYDLKKAHQRCHQNP
jgi:transposase